MTLRERLAFTSQRGPGFDHIRLFAALIVLLHHCRTVQYADLRDDALFHFSHGFMDFGRFAVVIFFALSGFLVTPGLTRQGDVVTYAVNRSLRIFPGLILNVVLTILVLGPLLTTHSLGSYFSDPQTYRYLKNIVTSMVHYLPGVQTRNGSPLIVNGALWTLRFELLCYIVLAIGSVVGLLVRRRFFLVLWLASYALYVAMNFEPRIASHLSDRFVTFTALFVYFDAGAVLFLFGDYIPFSSSLAIAATAATLIALPLEGGAIVMPLSLPYVAVSCGLSFLPGKALLRHDLSYGVYVIHAPILVALIVLFPGLRIWWVAVAVVFSVTIVLAYASWIFIESPALKRKKAVSQWARRGLEAVNPVRRRRTEIAPSEASTEA